METVLQAALLVVAILCLWKGAEWLVDAAAVVARTLGVSELVIGLTIVAFGTSAPEFAVTVGAALKGYANISVGNVVGSNIFNLGFILGGVALVRGIETTRRIVYRDGLILILASVLLLAFLWDFTLAHWEGLVMILCLGAYIFMLFWVREPVPRLPIQGRARWKHWGLLGLGIGLVILGGELLVESATFLARAVGVSEWVIGVTVVAAGTSAPEFFTSLVAALKGRHGISAGNLIGSDLFNIMGVLGLAGLLRSMQVDTAALGSLVVLLIMVTTVVIFMRTGWRLSRWEGAFLVTVNLARWVTEFFKG